tara:strand:+ start:375 stop:836 length:462 start_codon:yes stop_codon:yes gene_type:complete
MKTYKSAICAKNEEAQKFHLKYPKGCNIKELHKYRWPVRKQWGYWIFRSSNLVLELQTKRGGWAYEIDLERINSTAEMLDWIFQLNHKNRFGESIYGNENQDLIGDLIQAFDDIFKPQANCCSRGKEKEFSGSELAKAYAKKLKNYNKYVKET